VEKLIKVSKLENAVYDIRLRKPTTMQRNQRDLSLPLRWGANSNVGKFTNDLVGLLVFGKEVLVRLNRKMVHHFVGFLLLTFDI